MTEHGSIVIRDARLEDAARLLEIYDYYVRQTAITFEYETPSLEAFRERMRRVMTRRIRIWWRSRTAWCRDMPTPGRFMSGRPTTGAAS